MTDSPPQVSIIVPIYNTEQYLKECVTSILAQTVQNIEVILVDDGSPDRAGELMEKLAAEDSRIVTIHQKNRGLPGARNAGLAVARGTHVGFVDSDDWIAPTMYEVLVGAISQGSADLAMCDLQRVTGSSRLDKTSRLRSGDYDHQEIMAEIFPAMIMDDELEGPDVLAVWRCLYRRDFLTEHGITFDEKAKYSEDYLFSLAVLLRAQRFAYAKHRHEYFYRENLTGISGSVKKDSWRTYVYLNRALENEVRSVEGIPESARLERQLWLHMLYFALNTSNRILGSGASACEKRSMLKEIVSSERLQNALANLRLPAYPALTRAKIAALRWRSPSALMLFDGAAKLIRRAR